MFAYKTVNGFYGEVMRTFSLCGYRVITVRDNLLEIDRSANITPSSGAIARR
jgi:hypothetical protein